MRYLPILGGLNSTKSTDIIPGDPSGSGCVWSGMAESKKGPKARRGRGPGELDLPVKKNIYFSLCPPFPTGIVLRRRPLDI